MYWVGLQKCETAIEHRFGGDNAASESTDVA